MKKYILAIDQGTTSSRAMILQPNGVPAWQAQREFTQYYPKSGLVEHNAEELWTTTYQCCQAVLDKGNLDSKQIIAIGITNQRETTVVWNRKTSAPIYHALVWQDRRTGELCRELARDSIAKTISAKTGLVIDSYFSATKIKWLLDNIPHARTQAERGELAFGTIESFLLWKLTGGKSHVTDATNASRTMLFNIRTQTWDEELLKFFTIPRQILPEVADNCADFGKTEKSLFNCEIPITAMIGDQQSALIGQQCTKPGLMKSTYGTGCFLLLNTGTTIVQSANKLLTTVAYRINNVPIYGLEGSIFNAGTTVKWLRDNLHVIKTSKEVEILARSVPDTNGVYFVSAFTGLGAPYWNPNARGALLGLTHNTQIAHIARAALESVCYRTCDLIEAMGYDGVAQIKLIRVDGGMAANNWMLQFLADVSGCTIERPRYIESTAIGVGLLAALGAGVYSNFEELNHQWQGDQHFKPSTSVSQRIRHLTRWKQAVSQVHTQ